MFVQTSDHQTYSVDPHLSQYFGFSQESSEPIVVSFDSPVLKHILKFLRWFQLRSGLCYTGSVASFYKEFLDIDISFATSLLEAALELHIEPLIELLSEDLRKNIENNSVKRIDQLLDTKQT
ncbi:hypothetical protein GEMRC1_004398 [Eukaryota sp. GEM-RC1]